jgi:hypothetical protein
MKEIAPRARMKKWRARERSREKGTVRLYVFFFFFSPAQPCMLSGIVLEM